MADVDALKQSLRRAIEAADPDGTYSDEAYDAVRAAIDALLPHTPIARPVDDEAAVADPWKTLFAQFGPRHTAGKAIEHDNFFNFLSFGALPKLPVHVADIVQEIEHETGAYNNLHVISPPGGGDEALLTIRGRYRLEAAEPQRYIVDFYEVEIHAEDDRSDDELRRAFGFDADQPLKIDLPKAPKLHSDVVYCDDELRINFGSMGGVYVLERAKGPWRSLGDTAAEAAAVG